MRHWLRPSLLRRTVLTLLVAFVLVWGVLSFKDYLSFKRDVQARDSLGRVTRTVLDSLQGLDASQARWSMLTADRQFNALRLQTEPDAPGALLFQLSDRDGALVYRSEGHGALPDLMTAVDVGQVEHAGMTYWPVMLEDGRWRLAIWVPAMQDTTALVRIGQELLGYLLLALPFVVLPLVLAVWQGLRPLRRLAVQVGQRSHSDLSALQEPTGYAELAPLVGAFNELLARARQHRVREQAFVQDAAHELKTPLAVIAAQAHVLAHSEDAQARAESLQALERGVRRVSRQVEQLLALSVLDGGGPCRWERLDLAELTRELMVELAPMAEAQGVDMGLDAPDTMPVVAEAAALRSILGNLLGNALLHGGSGGRIEVALGGGERGAVWLVVADNGPGIPEDERERVFERFQRGATPGGSGSGLGLSIVRQAAERMGARLALEPGIDGRGLAVRVSWTPPPDSPADAQMATASGSGRATRSSLLSR